MLVFSECEWGYAITGTTHSCGWEVETTLSKLTLIKKTQYFLLITLHALNIGQAGWVSQCKINQSYIKNPRATFQLTKFSLYKSFVLWFKSSWLLKRPE